MHFHQPDRRFPVKAVQGGRKAQKITIFCYAYENRPPHEIELRRVNGTNIYLMGEVDKALADILDSYTILEFQKLMNLNPTAISRLRAFVKGMALTRTRYNPMNFGNEKQQQLSSTHPGEILLEEFMQPTGINKKQLATRLGVSQSQVGKITNRQSRITLEFALRLSRFFGNSPEFWLGLQADYDLDIARDSGLVERIEREVLPLQS